MADPVAKHVLLLILVVVNAFNISNTAKGFFEGRYFSASTSLMVSIWMICIFVKVFFDL